MIQELHELLLRPTSRILAVTALVGVAFLLLFACGRQPEPVPQLTGPLISDGEHIYRLIRPERQIGPNLKEIALYERIGVSTNE
jgi:hypothetical protein